ncbi:MAG TPA: hypothetical protein VGP72_16530 [Planctomycetota bacterium]|jgi:hypothetical protein
MAAGDLVITACGFGGAQFGIAQDIEMRQTVGTAPLQSQGAMGIGTLGTIMKGGTATVTWVAGSGASLIAPMTKNTLSFTCAKASGVGNVAGNTYSMSNMVALDGAIIHKDRTYCIMQQTFMNVSEDGAPFG